VEFVAVNTDAQALSMSTAVKKIPIGGRGTRGLGAGGDPVQGERAAEVSRDELGDVVEGADMVFLTAGLGGGTGTGAAPIIADIARRAHALTVAVVTLPFTFEGARRRRVAEEGLDRLRSQVDALIVIPNDRLVSLAGVKTTLKEAFAMVDNVCLNAVRGISDLVMVPGLINVDFADVRTIMTGMGRALMGSGRGSGDKRAIDAAQMAINSPLLEDISINGATGILVNITGGPDLTLAEVNEACSLIQEAADPDANIIFGSVIDPNCGDEVRITVIATGFQARAVVEAPVTQAVPAGEQSAIQDVVARYLRAYLSGDAGALAYLVPPGTRVGALAQRLRLVRVDSLALAVPPAGRVRVVVALVSARDRASGATYELGYRLRLVREDRWLVAAVNDTTRREG
jgi:cell division protein FtsZ